MMRTSLLLAIAVAYSAAVAAIGRRLARPASLVATSTALAVLVAVPLLPDPVAQRVDPLLRVVGAGRLLVHLAFMTVLCGLVLTIVLATHRWAWRQQVKTPFTTLVLALTAMVLVGQIWLLPLWRHRRQLLARYVAPELAQLRHDLLNLSAAEAERHLDIHHTAYANRAVVEAVAARCRAAGISPARVAMARMVTSLITVHRDNLLQDPGYGMVTSWADLMQEAAQEIDQRMAGTAWDKALRDGYVSQQVYILLFLVLDSRAFHEILLIKERPRVEPWHQQLADLIATSMQEHGLATPRSRTRAPRVAPGHRLPRLWARLVSRWGSARLGRPLWDRDDPR